MLPKTKKNCTYKRLAVPQFVQAQGSGEKVRTRPTLPILRRKYRQENMKSKEIELTEASQEAPEPEVDVPITFCTHVGFDGVLLLLFPLGISGIFVYITF